MPGALITTFRRKSVADWRNDIARAIQERGVLQLYKRKETVFQQGSPATMVYAVKSGMIETSCLNQGGREVTLSIRGPGESFGYSEAVLGGPRTRQAGVLQDAEIWKMASDQFMEMIAGRPDILLAMLGSALHRVTRSSEMRADLRGSSASIRVGYVLSRLAASTDELATAGTPELCITHEELSRVCDLSRQTVSKVLETMQRRDIVALGLRSIRVLDRARLANDIEDEGQA
jgi:CRP/FNR family transcriptional regulator, cyclic AMP receptor protein